MISQKSNYLCWSILRGRVRFFLDGGFVSLLYCLWSACMWCLLWFWWIWLTPRSDRIWNICVGFLFHYHDRNILFAKNFTKYTINRTKPKAIVNVHVHVSNSQQVWIYISLRILMMFEVTQAMVYNRKMVTCIHTFYATSCPWHQIMRLSQEPSSIDRQNFK